MEEIFEHAAALPAAERAAWLDAACAEEPALRAEVEALLRSHDADGFMQGAQVRLEIQAELARLKPEEAGEVIGPYKLLEQIGEGGFGTVWNAEQKEPVRRRVALKILKLGMDTKEVLARFEQERQALALMDHPSIARVFDAGATRHGRPFIVMEMVAGVKITEFCDGQNLAMRERLELFMVVCQAVQHAHQKGVIHRDLKPSNILVTLQDGVPVPKVIDFGVAKAVQQRLSDLTVYTQFEQMIGTPPYMSPEQAEMSALNVDTRTDIYALGALLYELLTGRTPFDSEKLMKAGYDEMRRVIREQDPQTPSMFLKSMADGTRAAVARRRQSDPAKLTNLVSGDLDWIVMKALEKERSRRYETATGMALDIQRHLASEPVLARPPTRLYLFLKLVRRNRTAFAASAAVAVALLAGVTGIAFQWRRAEAAGQATRERLAHEHVRAGLRMAENGDAHRGLPHFVEALRLGLGSAARERVTRLRFEMTIRQSPRLAQLWLRKQDGQAYFAEEAERVVIIDGAEVQVWDANTGTAVSAPMRHSGELRYAWMDRQVSRLVTEMRSGQITIWDPATTRVLAEMNGKGHIRGVIGGPRLRLALWPTKGHTVQCVSALDGVVDATFEHPDLVVWAVIVPDGTRVLAATSDSLYLWDVASRALVIPPVDFGGRPDFWRFDPSGRFAGLRVQFHGDLALFDVTTGMIVARGGVKTSGSVGQGWLDDGKRWVALARKFSGSALRDPVTDRLLVDADTGAGTAAISFATRRNIFVMAGENGAAQLWDADTARAIPPRLWAAGRPHAIQLGADATKLLVISSEPAVRLWKISAHGGPVWTAIEPAPALATWWNAKSGQLCTVGADGRLTRRDSATGRLASEPVTLDEPATAAIPNRVGRLFFAAGPHGARLWDAETGEAAGPRILCVQPVRSAALDADGRLAAIVAGEQVLLCDPVTGTVRHTLTHPGALTCVISPDGTRLASITLRTVQLWDTESGCTIGRPVIVDIKRHHACATFDAIGKRLAVWWAEPELPGHVRIIDPATGLDLQRPFEHPSVVTDAVFSPAGDLLVTASGDQRLWLWRTKDGRPAFSPVLHAHAINAVGFSPDGLLVWSRVARQLHTWETATGDAAGPVLQHLGPPPPEPGRRADGGPVTHDDEGVRIAWSADQRFATCDGRGGVNLWDFSAGTRPLEEMEALARVLSSHRIDPSGGLVPLSREELRAAWEPWRRIAARRKE